jgi:hypothetical protein
MKAKQFEKKAQILIDKFQNLIDLMPYRGDVCSESQKLCLQQALNELDHNVNGVEDLDFKVLRV